MSIDRRKLFEIIKKRLILHQNKLECGIDLILFLLEKVIFCDPTKGCIVKSKREAWTGLPRSKSLFFSKPDKGLPIGNLTSQLFANIYLNEVDQFIKRELGMVYYGRYVDDTVLVDKDRDKLLAAIPEISDYLKSNLSVTLHPRKIYLQHFSKGISFLGVYIKPYRMLAGKRLRRNFHNMVHDELVAWGEMDHTRRNYRQIKEFDRVFRQHGNAYLGILRQADSFLMREKAIKPAVDGIRGVEADKNYDVITLSRV